MIDIESRQPNMDITQITTALKAFTPKGAAIVAVFGLIVLLMPSELAQQFGVGWLKGTEWFGVLTLLSLCSCIVWVAFWFLNIIKKKWKEMQTKRNILTYLKELSSDEKAILKRYIDQDKSTLILSEYEGVANSLAAKNILLRMNSRAYSSGELAYTIHPVAKRLLLKHPGLL